MILRRLTVEGFGRLRGRQLELQPGLNVLWGPNEAGKSTLHAFLDAMLFGFRQTRTQDGRQRRHRAYAPEREFYRPWDGGPYAGALEYEHDGRRYLVRRDFAQDSLVIRDALTGRDVAGEFAADPLTGEPDFARRHAGLTPLIFRNTVSVRQAAAGIDHQAFPEEIREALLRPRTSGDRSGADALAALAEAIERIGTPRRGNSPLGRAQARVEELQAARERAQRALALTRALERLQAQREAAEHREAALRAERERLAEARWAARYREVLRVQAELATLADFPLEREGELARLQAAVAAAEQALASESAELARRADERTAAAAAVAALGGLTPADLAAAQAAWQEAEALRRRADAARARRQRLAALAGLGADTLARARRLQAAARAGRSALLAAAGAAVTLLGLAVPGPGRALALVGLLATVAGLVRHLAARRAARQLTRLLRTAGAADLEALERLDDERRLLLAQPDEDPAGLTRDAEAAEARSRSLLAASGLAPGDWEAAAARLQQALSAHARAEERYGEQQRRAEAARAALAEAERRLATFLSELGLPSAAAFAERAGAARRRRELRTRLEALLDGTTLAELAARFPDGPPAEAPAVTEGELAQVHAAWLAALADLNRLKDEEARLRTELGPEPPALGAVEAELRQALAQRQLLETRRRALELARDTLAEVEQAMQREFAPVLHARLAELAPALTGGRYRQLHVDEDLHVTVRVPERSDPVPAERLSRGAMDQIVLAARIALAELATGGRRPPLVLDDALAHCDDDRLAGALRALADLARDGQVLLLTCHGRVAAALAAGGIPHTLVAV